MSAASSPGNIPSYISSPLWEKSVAYAFGVLFVMALLVCPGMSAVPALDNTPTPANTPGYISSPPWEKIAAYAFGVLFVMALLILAIAFPEPTSFQYTMFRIVLALAGGGVAAVIPGFLAVNMDMRGLVIRAGGALAVFVLVYFFNPAQLVVSVSSLNGRPADGRK